RGGNRRAIAKLFVAVRQRLEHVLRAVALGQLHVEAFGSVIALLQSNVERRILALELPSEANRQPFRSLPAGDVVRRYRQRERRQYQYRTRRCDHLCLCFHSLSPWSLPFSFVSHGS